MEELVLKSRKKSINTHSSMTFLGGSAMSKRGTIFPSNELLCYTSYIAVTKFQKKKGRSPHGVYFNKIMSLAHRSLKEQGIDIGLPHYWYRYGDQVHIQSMPSALVWNHENQYKTIVEWTQGKPSSYNDATYRLINKTIEELTNKYAGKNKEIIQEVYKNAPYEFQRKILNLRSIIHGWKYALNWDSRSYQTVSKEVILNALSTFPDRVFPELEEQYKIFKIVVEIMLEKEDWDFVLFEELCITFWFWFCYYLRIKKDARENIPKETVAYWESNLDFENFRYRRIMGDILIKVARDFPKIRKNRLLEREYTWRIKDLEEAKLLIDEFIDS